MIDKLQAALEALENSQLDDTMRNYQLQSQSITDLKAVIAEMEAQEPVAFSYELAAAKTESGEYWDWQHRLTAYQPCVTDNAIRDLKPLYTHPQPKSSDTLTPQYESMPDHPVCIGCGHRLMSSMTYTCYACNQTSDPRVIREAFEKDDE